jgi:hypothetical protein
MGSIPAPANGAALDAPQRCRKPKKSAPYPGLTAWLTRSLPPQARIRELPDLQHQFPLHPGGEMIRSGYLHLADTGHRFRIGCVDCQKFAPRLEFDPRRVADDDARRDFVRPALLARVVGLRRCGRGCEKNQPGGRRQPTHGSYSCAGAECRRGAGMRASPGPCWQKGTRRFEFCATQE